LQFQPPAFYKYQDAQFTSGGINHDLQLTEGYLFTVISLGNKLDNDVHYESIPSTMWEEGGRRTTPQLRTGISEKQWRRKLAYLEDLKKDQERRDASAAEFRLKNLTRAPHVSIDALKRFWSRCSRTPVTDPVICGRLVSTTQLYELVIRKGGRREVSEGGVGRVFHATLASTPISETKRLERFSRIIWTT
jgi:hypothetical protein